MRFLLFLLIQFCLVQMGQTAESEAKPEDLRVLNANHISTFIMSSSSRKEFKLFLENYCLTDLSREEFIDNYIKWEQVEFVNNLYNILDPSENDRLIWERTGEMQFYHQIESNCTHRNDTKQSTRTITMNAAHSLETYFYDSMLNKAIDGIDL